MITQEFGSPQLGSFSLKITGTTTYPTIFWRVLGKASVDITADRHDLKKRHLLDWTKEYGTCSTSSYVTKADCQAHNKTWNSSNNKNNWNGCVLDRDKDNDVADTTPDTGTPRPPVTT